MLRRGMLCRDSFIERTDTPTVPHDILKARRDDYEAKSDAACELRQESMDKLQAYLQLHRSFLGAFQSLRDTFNEMVSCNGTSIMRSQRWRVAYETQPEALQPRACGPVLPCRHNELCVSCCLPLHQPTLCKHHSRMVPCAAGNHKYFPACFKTEGCTLRPWLCRWRV